MLHSGGYRRPIDLADSTEDVREPRQRSQRYYAHRVTRLSRCFSMLDSRDPRSEERTRAPSPRRLLIGREWYAMALDRRMGGGRTWVDSHRASWRAGAVECSIEPADGDEQAGQCTKRMGLEKSTEDGRTAGYLHMYCVHEQLPTIHS